MICMKQIQEVSRVLYLVSWFVVCGTIAMICMKQIQEVFRVLYLVSWFVAHSYDMYETDSRGV